MNLEDYAKRSMTGSIAISNKQRYERRIRESKKSLQNENIEDLSRTMHKTFISVYKDMAYDTKLLIRMIGREEIRKCQGQNYCLNLRKGYKNWAKCANKLQKAEEN